VNTILQKLLASVRAAYPSGSSPYWRALPLRRMKSLVAGAFLLGSVGGFALNLLQFGAPRLEFFWPLLWGTGVTIFLVGRIKKARLLPLVILVFVAVSFLAGRPAVAARFTVPESEKQRVLFNVVGIWIGVFFGFRLLLYFVTTEGLANVRLQTEFSLAHDIQATLVPAVSLETASLEVYGKSLVL